MSVLAQKSPYTGSINRETFGDSKNTFLHCGDVSLLHDTCLSIASGLGPGLCWYFSSLIVPLSYTPVMILRAKACFVPCTGYTCRSQAMTCHKMSCSPICRPVPWQAVYVINHGSCGYSAAYVCTGHEARSQAMTCREMPCRGACLSFADRPHGRQYML